jgi:hypothetical protein
MALDKFLRQTFPNLAHDFNAEPVYARGVNWSFLESGSEFILTISWTKDFKSIKYATYSQGYEEICDERTHQVVALFDLEAQDPDTWYSPVAITVRDVNTWYKLSCVTDYLHHTLKAMPISEDLLGEEDGDVQAS